MPKVITHKLFDDYQPGSKMTSYQPGEYDVSDAVAERMRGAGVLGDDPAKSGEAKTDKPGK